MRLFGLAGFAASLLLTSSFAQATTETLTAPSDIKVSARGDGWVFADAKGMALYVFDGDEATPGKSACNGACAQQWPPLPAAADAKADGAWSPIPRADGTMQWAYNDRPLYTYAEEGGPDTSFGDGETRQWRRAFQPIWMPPGITLQQSLAGSVLADAKGLTLYTFDLDTTAGKTRCSGTCLQAWAPAVAPSLANSSGDWSVVTRDDGATQWAYKGKALYRNLKDVHPGENHGDGAGEAWRAAELEPPAPEPSWVTLRPSLAGEIKATAEGLALYYRGAARGRGNPNGGKPCESATCMGSDWKAVLAEKNAQPAGNWTIIDNKDGSQQWAFRGHRLYTYAMDKPSEQFLGIRFGGDRSWTTIMRNGSPIQNM